MGSLDCNEYENLRKRGFKPYSAGHRMMYDTPAKLLSGRKRRIVEAGFGIGYGLETLLDAGAIGTYLGFEPNRDSFGYVHEKHGGLSGVELRNTGFATTGETFDHVFCIEVIEHVPMDGHAEFIGVLRRSGKTLWMSTPDVKTHPHEGVRRPDEWKAMLKAGGFNDVTVHCDQWTVLFVAQ